MKAMILAAGLGTRLRPLTNERPKALVEIGGMPLLEHAITMLKKFGIRDVIINTHHFAEQIVNFLQENNYFDIRIAISHEGDLLNTGGGLKKASWFFNDNKPFLLYNTDVLSNIDLSVLLESHLSANPLATLAVRKRKTSRYFLFDEQDKLVGWESKKSGEIRLCAKPQGRVTPLSFMGIHIISAQIFDQFSENGAFSIVDSYLRLAGEGYIIKGFRADDYAWLDCGRLENLTKSFPL